MTAAGRDLQIKEKNEILMINSKHKDARLKKHSP